MMRKAKRLLREYPYLLNDTVYIRSQSEAKRMYAEGFPSLGTIVARAKGQSGLPAEAWAYFEKAAATTEKQAQRTKESKEWINENIARIAAHKRMAIACTILAIILAFFTLFPTGRALAKEMFDYILNVFGHKIEIVDTEYSSYEGIESLPADSNLGVTNSTVEYDSITEFYNATGLEPFALDLKGWDCTVIVEKNSETTGKSLKTEYQIDDGDGTIVVMQKWLLNGQYDVWSNDDFDNEITLSNGTKFYYSIDAIDGSLNGVCLIKNSVLRIYVNKEPYNSQVLTALQ